MTQTGPDFWWDKPLHRVRAGSGSVKAEEGAPQKMQSGHPRLEPEEAVLVWAELLQGCGTLATSSPPWVPNVFCLRNGHVPFVSLSQACGIMHYRGLFTTCLSTGQVGRRCVFFSAEGSRGRVNICFLTHRFTMGLSVSICKLAYYALDLVSFWEGKRECQSGHSPGTREDPDIL